MKSRWITHKGKTILYCDYSNLKDDVAAVEAEDRAVRAEVVKQPLDSVLELVDVRSTVGSRETVAILKESAKVAKPHLRKVAVIGVQGVVKVLASAVSQVSGLGLTLFATEEEAKEWFVSGQ